MSFRYASGIRKPGFNPLAAQTTTTTYSHFLYGWGTNSDGQLGINNTTAYSSPKQIGSSSAWSVLAAGAETNSAAIGTDGSLWAWGHNNYGQLGDGTRTSKSSPVQIGALTNWSNVVVGTHNCLALKTDGTMWGWGYNASGNLGLGNTTNYSSPKQVGSLTNWAKIANGGYARTFALKTDGTIWTWGFGNNGANGLGNTTAYSSPKQIGALTNWLKVVASFYCSHAIKTDGTLWAWGYNAFGQQGNGSATNNSSPVQIGALTDWYDVAPAYQHTAAVRTNGALYAYGKGAQGQLGHGNLTYYSSPKQIGALSTWRLVATGQHYTLAGLT